MHPITAEGCAGALARTVAASRNRLTRIIDISRALRRLRMAALGCPILYAVPWRWRRSGVAWRLGAEVSDLVR